MALVLAIESDPRQAATVKRLFRDRVNVELVLVESRETAIAAIHKRLPDLILVSALFSPRDETALAACLRNRSDAAHLQTLTIPLFAAAAEPTPQTKRGLLSKLRGRKVEEPHSGCDPELFAEEVQGYLTRAKQVRAEHLAAVEPASSAEREPSAETGRAGAQSVRRPAAPRPSGGRKRSRTDVAQAFWFAGRATRAQNNLPAAIEASTDRAGSASTRSASQELPRAAVADSLRDLVCTAELREHAVAQPDVAESGAAEPSGAVKPGTPQMESTGGVAAESGELPAESVEFPAHEGVIADAAAEKAESRESIDAVLSADAAAQTPESSESIDAVVSADAAAQSVESVEPVQSIAAETATPPEQLESRNEKRPGLLRTLRPSVANFRFLRRTDVTNEQAASPSGGPSEVQFSQRQLDSPRATEHTEQDTLVLSDLSASVAAVQAGSEGCRSVSTNEAALAAPEPIVEPEPILEPLALSRVLAPAERKTATAEQYVKRARSRKVKASAAGPASSVTAPLASTSGSRPASRSRPDPHPAPAIQTPARKTRQPAPLAMWVRQAVDLSEPSPPAVHRAPDSHSDLQAMMSDFMVPAPVAGVSYPRGCRIRRVRVASRRSADTRADEPVIILSRKMLRELRGQQAEMSATT